MRCVKRDSVRVFLPSLAVAIGALALATQQWQDGDAAASAAAPNPSGSTGDRAPTIVVAAAGARVDANYQITPRVSAADGDALSFSADNLPPWARIDPRSGTIAGTPHAADVGVYESITITVDDGTRRATSQPFAITVVGGPAAHLAWRKPELHVDGSVLDDLAGYRIVYGRNPDDLDHSIFIADPNQLSYDFDTLNKGAWYFAVIALTADGLEGPPTVPAMKVI